MPHTPKPDEDKKELQNINSIDPLSDENFMAYLDNFHLRLSGTIPIIKSLRQAIRSNDLKAIEDALKNPNINLEMGSLLRDENLDFVNDVTDDERLYTALALACRFSHLDTVKFLVEKGAHVDGELRSSSKSLVVTRLPLEAAIIAKDISKVNYLLENKANPNLRWHANNEKCLLQVKDCYC